MGVVRYDFWRQGAPLINLAETGDMAYWLRDAATIFVGADTGLLNLQASLLIQTTMTAALTVDELLKSAWAAQVVF